MKVQSSVGILVAWMAEMMVLKSVEQLVEQRDMRKVVLMDKLSAA